MHPGGVSAERVHSVPAPNPESRRRYPRVPVDVPVRLSLADAPDRTFEAKLPASNISVGGLFLSSSFFLKPGTRLLVELSLPPQGRAVRAYAEVARLEAKDERHSGFALRFTEYLDGSEIALATHFLAPVLADFLGRHWARIGVSPKPEQLAQTVDVLAAWELEKASLGDVWSAATAGLALS